MCVLAGVTSALRGSDKGKVLETEGQGETANAVAGGKSLAELR